MRKLVWLAIGICCGCALGVYAFGSTAAAPVFKEIAEPLLVMKGVPPDQTDFE